MALVPLVTALALIPPLPRVRAEPLMVYEAAAALEKTSPRTEAGALRTGSVAFAPAKVAKSLLPGALLPSQLAPALKSVPEFAQKMDAAQSDWESAGRTSAMRTMARYLGFMQG